MVWSKPEIIKAIKKAHKAGRDLSYNALAKRQQSLVSAAAYHFGSYRRAVEAAGIDYSEVVRRPRWNKPLIIRLIKAAKRRGDDLHWSAVTKRRDELGKAAFAALQPRLFGSWDRALHGAGLDAEEVSRYRKWDADTVVFHLKLRHRAHEPLNSGALQREDPGLHAAAVRHYSNYDAALRAAKIDPETVRTRRRWQSADVLRGLKAMRKERGKLTDTSVRRSQPALYGAAIRLFGSFAVARSAAGIRGR